MDDLDSLRLVAALLLTTGGLLIAGIQLGKVFVPQDGDDDQDDMTVELIPVTSENYEHADLHRRKTVHTPKMREKQLHFKDAAARSKSLPPRVPLTLTIVESMSVRHQPRKHSAYHPYSQAKAQVVTP